MQCPVWSVCERKECRVEIERAERDREPDWRWSSGQDRPGKGKGRWRRKKNKKRRQRVNQKIFAKKEKISRMFGLNILQQGRGEERNQRQRQVKLDSFLVGTLAKCLHSTGLGRPYWK